MQHLEASQSPLDVANMRQHVSPLETTSSFHMPAELNFTNPGQRTPEFVSTQPDFGHRNLANTPIVGPLLTPTHNQFMDPSPFTETSPTNHLHAINQGPAQAQADPSASFTGWSPAFQQNMFSPVEYSNGTGRQMPPHMMYPSYGPYSSPQDAPQTFAVPELSRPRDYDMANMYNLPFRTGSLSHPYIVHRRDSGDVKPGM
jgi:hypothetical protein